MGHYIGTVNNPCEHLDANLAKHSSVSDEMSLKKFWITHVCDEIPIMSMRKFILNSLYM